MPARVVVVHDEPDFIERTVAALRAAGHEVMAFTSSMSAIDALKHPQQIEVLVTRVIFPEGQPNGVSLALMTKMKKSSVKVLFAALPETQNTLKGWESFCLPLSTPPILSRASAICLPSL